MKHLLHLPEGHVLLEKEEIVARVQEILAACPSEHTNAFRVWYEGFEGCGRPSAAVRDIIDEAIASAGDWTSIGPMRWERYGVVDPSYINENYANEIKELGGNAMIQHMYHVGKHYQGPDGRVFWVAVAEVFDLRCFERKDGKYVGQMVEIDPLGDYARQMVEVQV